MDAQLVPASKSDLLQGSVQAIECSFAGVRIKLPADWSDISSDLPRGTIPTLAKLLGNGVLQFRVWRRLLSLPVSFNNVDATSAVLAFAEEFELGAPLEIESGFETSNFAVSTYHRGDDVVRVWCFAAGRSVALLTYVGYAPAQSSSELSEAHGIAMSLVFDDAPGQGLDVRAIGAL